jgi:hypothetical protein
MDYHHDDGGGLLVREPKNHGDVVATAIHTTRDADKPAALLEDHPPLYAALCRVKRDKKRRKKSSKDEESSSRSEISTTDNSSSSGEDESIAFAPTVDLLQKPLQDSLRHLLQPHNVTVLSWTLAGALVATRRRGLSLPWRKLHRSWY